MVNNIKIIGNIIDFNTISRYSENDVKLIKNQIINEDFGEPNDYIEYFVYDLGGNLLNINYNYLDFKLASDSYMVSESGSLPIIEIDPVKDLQNLGYSSGEFKVQYNFLNNKISSPEQELFIKEISSDRTEIRIASTILSNKDIEDKFNILSNEITNSPYYSDYLLNFGLNKQILAINIALNKAETGYEILFKLYEPLDNDVIEKDTLWVVKEKVNPYTFDINLDILIYPKDVVKLRGANFNIPINQNTLTTQYENYESLLNIFKSGSNSTYNQILSLINSKNVEINTDYTDFANFSFFGAVTKRLNNFYTKIKQIEDYNTLITTYTPLVATNASLQTEINRYSSSISDLTSNFDKYEYFLYYKSGSYSWPKSGSVLPYENLSTGSAAAISWYNNFTGSAITYDSSNANNLVNLVPSYLVDDTDNESYLTFLNMMGQYFDNIWIYLKAVTDVNLSNNNKTEGISKDLVYNTLKSFGIKLYNTQGSNNINTYLIGANSGSNNFTDNFSISSSYLNNIPGVDLTSETYKRLYNNLPYLVKTRGTVSGLEALITIFGVTGSILNIKEYGGELNSNFLIDYNPDKVRIINNTISGSVLSPIIRVENKPTLVTSFRRSDLHYLDASFSPQTQIDTHISSSISSSNPTFNLDDYLGDPRLLYSSSYSGLVTQNTLYMSEFTGSNLDYNGFIRLIQYFDNSLFQMIEDFIPARSNLSTGVTFNSPLLERNKVAYSIPSGSQETVHEVNISSSTFSSEYNNFYNWLPSYKEAYYNGNISGSNTEVYNDYYTPNNFNPYLTLASRSRSNDFNHSNFNILLNNVSSSRLSLIRRKKELREDGSILLVSSSIQDSDLYLTSYKKSRHNGVKISSTSYNTYTDGDISYGKTSTIDHNVRKIGLFTQVTSSLFPLPYRNNIQLKYLVDENGNLTELNQKNKHWEEVQNTFKAGNILNISLFDNQKFTNQKSLDGLKSIYNSGYSYYPILYYTKASDTKLYFQYTGTNSSKIFSAKNINGGSLQTGSFTYPLTLSGSSGIRYAYSIFDTVTFNEGGHYAIGSGTTFPTYTVPESDNYKFLSDFNINLENVSGSLTFQYDIKNATTTLVSVSQSFTASTYATALSPSTKFYYASNGTYCAGSEVTASYGVDPIPLPSSSNAIILYNSLGSQIGTIPANTNLWGYSGSYSYSTCDFPFGVGINVIRIALIATGSTYTGINIPGITQSSEVVTDGISSQNIYYLENAINYSISDNQSGTLVFDTETTFTSFSSGDPITFQLSLTSGSSTNFTASVTEGLNTVSLNSTSGALPFATSSAAPFVSGSSTYGLILNESLSGFKDYLFLGNTGSNSLYSTYGDVDYNFSPTLGDKVIITSTSNQTTEHDIVSASLSGSFLHIVTSELPAGIVSSVDNISKVVFLARKSDETNILISFNKRSGQTSYGLVIPDNLHPDVLKKIDTITKEVKQKLIENQTNLN